MKTLLLTLFVLAQTLTAKPLPSFRTAEMIETDSAGNILAWFVPISFTLTENKRGSKTMSFEFVEKSLNETKRWVFKDIKQSMSKCGSTQYEGSTGVERMVLVDNSTRVCDDIRPAVWEMRFYGGKKMIRYFQGNPKSNSNLNCERYTQGNICVALYMPVTCYYNSYSAEGSNSCYAIGELKKSVCEDGMNADKIQDEDISCKNHLCPMPICAAPPEGCKYVPSDKLNEEGCPLYPCGLLECNGDTQVFNEVFSVLAP